ncbi:chaperonin 10-like protein [Coniella lustricola]|uniref:Chaperonin 10-like protein n=1 Tax=Coniella lustricola TaxID=2025994 RepID=A0A2T3A9X5_9PEZI|nr:chaperonin 10-like protein [Coniella lustricola]
MSASLSSSPPPLSSAVPETQRILLLHGPRQPYKLVEDYPVPKLQGDAEVLVKTNTIGLNPIDWKAPDYNFAIPELPYISGRELSGDICQISSESSRFKIGDRVIAISTDYRDPRKAAYQSYAVSFDFNTVRLPARISYEEGSTLGVAFVAASLALCICMGVDFSDVADGPDLLKIVKEIDPALIPEDVRAETLHGISDDERARPGDWLAVWGGSATSANLTVQLARLAGLKVATIVDSARHGLRISNHKFIRPDLMIDSHDPQRAVQILQHNIGDEVRFGLDTRGKDTAAMLLEGLTKGRSTSNSAAPGGRPPSPPGTPRSSTSAHLIGLTGLPKGAATEGVTLHSVPIKLFHEVPAVGHALVTWLERLLEQGLVSPPEIIDIEEGLENVNTGLDRMRNGEIRGGKLVVRLAN